jgi:protein-tyrosine phosphatase
MHIVTLQKLAASLLAILFVLAGPTIPVRAHAAPAVAAHAPIRDRAIPFEIAEVSSIAQDQGYDLRWNAPEAGRVRVYAGHDPDGRANMRLVASGGAAGHVRVQGLRSAARWYFTLVPEHGTPLTIADRNLHLATAPNFRDVGGYRTADGRWVRMGRLYRSDQLDRLSDIDLAKIAALGVGMVADLRTTAERTRDVDRLPPDARTLVLDVLSESTAASDMSAVMAEVAAGRGLQSLSLIYRDMVSAPAAQRAYAGLLRELSKPAQSRASLFHCTAGKDRTGVAAAIILSLLGVPRETVIADYMRSNEALAAKNERALAERESAGSTIPREYLLPVMTVRLEFIETAFAEIDLRFGSVEEFARKALQMDDAALAALREDLLVGSANDRL